MINKEILEIKLRELGVEQSSYSLNNELTADCTILYHSYNEWEVFYLDERGERHQKGLFDNEEDACIFLYELFKKSKEIESEYKLNK